MDGGRPDLGFFADPPAAAPPARPFGTPAPLLPPGRSRPAPAPAPRRSGAVLAGVLGLVLLLVAAGVVVMRAWRASGDPAPVSVSTPATIGPLTRSTPAAPTIAPLLPDLEAVAPLGPPVQAAYTDGAVSVEVLAALPRTRLVLDDQSRLLTALTAGLERLTGAPPQLNPVGLSVTGVFSCSQIELGAQTAVVCAATSSGAVTLVLVRGQDYPAATETAAQVRGEVEQRS